MTATDLAHWPATFDEYRKQQTALVQAGEWTHGHADLMHVLGVQEDELRHSRMVAWLLDPMATHGLGDRILSRILEEGWRGDPSRPLPRTELAVVSREVPLDRTRADVVVRVGQTVLVLENKVMADESSAERDGALVGQCECLYREWLDHEPGSDLRFLLLSLDGHIPKTATSGEAKVAWRSLSYASLGALLEEALADAGAGAPGQETGRESARQYAATLRTRPFRSGRAAFQIHGGGGEVG